jgi:hypothetical protein
MTEKKAPDAAVVEQAQGKIEAGDDLSKREAAALEAQAEIDRQRGYRRIEWRPGIFMWQHIATQHTIPDGEGGEAEMRRVHLEYLTGRA